MYNKNNRKRKDKGHHVQYLMKHHKNRSGFTIVELLIVIVVIAILATISIVAYRGIQERARASQVSTGIAQAKKKLELYKVDNGTYPTTGNLAAADVKDADVSYQYTSDGITYCITGTIGTTSYKATNTGSAEQGGCAGHGQGGVAAITNMTLNPKAKNDASGWSTQISSGGTATGARQIGQSTTLAGVTTTYRITITAAPATWWRSQLTGYAVTPGQSYSLSAFMRPSVGGNMAILMVWYNSTGAYLSESASTVNQAAGSWQSRSVTAVAPAGAATARLQFGGTSTAAAGTYLDVTGVMFEQSAEVHAFADGDSPDWIWNGTPNNSTSTGPPL